MLTKTRKCRECGDRLVGRADKKFCGDACRNTYNNRHNRDVNRQVRKINYSLRKNRRILDELTPNDKVKAARDELLARGFSFAYITHQYETKKGTVYHFCYDLGYLLLDNEEVLIVRKECRG